MILEVKLRRLNNAKNEFSHLSKSAYRKAQFYKLIDIFIKAVLSIVGGLLTFFADPNSTEDYKTVIRIFGIIIACLTALVSVFMFEKRSLANIQIYNKCIVVVDDLNDKIDTIKNGQNPGEDLEEYIRKLFKDLSNINLSTFTDSILERINTHQD